MQTIQLTLIFDLVASKSASQDVFWAGIGPLHSYSACPVKRGLPKHVVCVARSLWRSEIRHPVYGEIFPFLERLDWPMLLMVEFTDSATYLFIGKSVLSFK